jgi:hypothetical protein
VNGLEEPLKKDIKLRKTRWAGHDACRKEMRRAYRILVGKAAGKRLFGGRMCRRRIIKLIVKKSGINIWTGFNWRRMGSSYGLLRTR